MCETSGYMCKIYQVFSCIIYTTLFEQIYGNYAKIPNINQITRCICLSKLTDNENSGDKIN